MTNIKKIIPIIIFLTTFLQLFIYFKNIVKDENEIIFVNQDVSNISFTSIKEIDSELNNIRNLKVNSQVYLDGRWKCNVLLSGNKKEIIEAIESLSDFMVLKYIIDGNGHVFHVNLEIIR